MNLQQPKEPVTVKKKFPYDAVVLVNEEASNTATQYGSDVIHHVVFPSGKILKEALPVYFDKMFNNVQYVKQLALLPAPNSVVIQTSISNITFREDCCLPLTLDIGVLTRFDLYDSDLIMIALPVSADGAEHVSKSSLFATLDEQEYAQTAYQATLKSLQNAFPSIYDAIENPTKGLLDAKDKINKDPSDVTAYKVVANLSLKKHDIPQAIAASQMVIQLNPKDIDGYLLLYKAYLSQKKYKDAYTQLEHAIALSPKSALLFTKQFDFFISRHQYEKAQQILEKYLTERPDDNWAFVKLSQLYWKRGQYQNVIAASEKIIQNVTFSGIGIAIGNKQNKEAFPKVVSIMPQSPASQTDIKAQDEIIEIDGTSIENLDLNTVMNKLQGPDNTSVHLKIRRAGSDDVIQKTVVRDTFYFNPEVAAAAMSMISLCYLELGDFSNAQLFLDRANKAYVNSTLVKIAQASFLLQKGHYEDTLKFLTDTKDDYAVFLSALALAKNGQYEESIQRYKTVAYSDHMLMGEKTKKRYFEALTPYSNAIENRAVEYEKNKQLRAALEEYQKLLATVSAEKAQWIRNRVAKIIASNPSLIEFVGTARQYYLHAEVLFTNNKFDEALAELDKAMELVPFNPQIYFNKALIYEKLADYAQAIENMEIFLSLNPSTPNAQIIRDQIYKWKFTLEKELS
jgi:tetratricopeptide (TPR) repeat protein